MVVTSLDSQVLYTCMMYIHVCDIVYSSLNVYITVHQVYYIVLTFHTSILIPVCISSYPQTHTAFCHSTHQVNGLESYLRPFAQLGIRQSLSRASVSMATPVRWLSLHPLSLLNSWTKTLWLVGVVSGRGFNTVLYTHHQVHVVMHSISLASYPG